MRVGIICAMNVSRPASGKAPSPGHAANMGGVAAVDRALSLLRTLQQGRCPMTLSELAASADLYPSTILRLMASLDRHALVIRHPDQRYTLGPFALLLGKGYEATARIEQQLLPIMQRLVETGAESPSFHVRSDPRNRLCLLRIDSHHSTLDRVRPGDLLPIDRGAAGRVLSEIDARDEQSGGDSLLKVSLGERDPSCAAVAGPVFGPDDELLGALSLSGPRERFDDGTIRRMRVWLLEACCEATESLGGRWSGRTLWEPTDN